MSTTNVGSLELTVLLAVARLGEDAYGLAIRRDVSQRTERDYSVGAIYTTLERLQSKRLLASRATAPTPTRGGRSRRLFRLTRAGVQSIEDARRLTNLAWSNVGRALKPRHA